MGYSELYQNFDRNKKYSLENITYDPSMDYDEYCRAFNVNPYSVVAKAEFRSFSKSMCAGENYALYEEEFLKEQIRKERAKRQEYENKAIAAWAYRQGIKEDVLTSRTRKAYYRAHKDEIMDHFDISDPLIAVMLKKMLGYAQ